MPRREAADDEDLMPRCPRCFGRGDVYDIETNTRITCPLCDGAGRVTRTTLKAYRASTQ